MILKIINILTFLLLDTNLLESLDVIKTNNNVIILDGIEEKKKLNMKYKLV